MAGDLLIELGGLVYFFIMSQSTGDYSYLLNNLHDFSSTPFFVWTLLEIITMLTNSKRRAIHDFLAKSVVVRTK